MIRTLLPLIFSLKFFQKLLAFGLLFILGYFLRDFLVLFFIIFIFAYLFLELGTLIADKIHIWGLHGNKTRTKRIAAQYATTNIIVSLLYILFIILVTFLFINIVPQIGIEIDKLARNAPRLAEAGQGLIHNVEKNIGINLGVGDLVSNFVNEGNIREFGQQTLSYIRDAGAILIKFLIGLLLSYIFIMERAQIREFLRLMQDGNFAFLYKEYRIIAGKVGKGFGLIFKAQSIIACVNAILTAIGLSIIGFFVGNAHIEPLGMMTLSLQHASFPYILTLSLIVFIFGFIPVFGTIISGIPIIIIGYGYGNNSSFGGLIIVLWILLMILIVHSVEAYILNPKIVSSYIHFPVFITFLVLIISEHILGLVGLLIGVPIFVILLGLLEDLDQYITEIKKELHA